MLNCPIHGEAKRINLNLRKSSLYREYGEVSACQCYLCKKIYINVKEIKMDILVVLNQDIRSRMFINIFVYQRHFTLQQMMNLIKLKLIKTQLIFLNLTPTIMI